MRSRVWGSKKISVGLYGDMPKDSLTRQVGRSFTGSPTLTVSGLICAPTASSLRIAGSRQSELGTGPSIVVVDAGMAKSLTTTTLQKDVYAFFFDQKGLMAGLGLQRIQNY